MFVSAIGDSLLLRAVTAAAAESEEGRREAAHASVILLARFGDPYRSTIVARLMGAQGSALTCPSRSWPRRRARLPRAEPQADRPDAMLCLADALLAGIVES